MYTNVTNLLNCQEQLYNYILFNAQGIHKITNKFKKGQYLNNFLICSLSCSLSDGYWIKLTIQSRLIM